MSEQETPDSAAAVQEDLEALRTRAQERDQFLDLLRRTQADFDNYQKRNRAEREQERRFAQKPLAQDLLPVLDNLERAVAAARQSNESGPLVQGVSMVLAQFQELLKRHNITRIEAEGLPFDPNLHMAVAQRPADATHPANTVAQVVEGGYMMHDRVLRPARVIVAMPQ
jgi:molecular chaperone GrpE